MSDAGYLNSTSNYRGISNEAQDELQDSGFSFPGDSSGLSGSSALGLGVAGVGALGLGSLLAQGPGQLPQQFGQVSNTAPWLTATGQSNISQGEGLVSQGQQALGMAQAGTLTPEQQAQLKVYSQGLTNQARQQFYNMGQNPDASTAFISTTADIDTKVNAMAQAQIQSTIQLGLGEISGGNSLLAAGGQEISAANQALLAAGEAQLKLDTQYSSNLTAAFGAIGQMLGTAGKLAMA